MSYCITYKLNVRILIWIQALSISWCLFIVILLFDVFSCLRIDTVELMCFQTVCDFFFLFINVTKIIWFIICTCFSRFSVCNLLSGWALLIFFFLFYYVKTELEDTRCWQITRHSDTSIFLNFVCNQLRLSDENHFL